MKIAEIKKKAKISNPSEQAIDQQFFTRKDAPGSYEMVLLEKIEPDPGNPRTSMDPEALKQLADSIEEKGIIHPVNLFQLDNGRYRLEEGHRRFEAAKIAGKTHLPAIIFMADDLTDEEIRERQLIENLHNEALPPIDAARAIKGLQDKHKFSVRDVAKKIALKKSAVQEYVGILRIPEELLDRAQSLGKKALVQVSAAPVSEMPDLIDQALKPGATVQQVKTQRREKKPLTYFRKSYQTKSWIEAKSRSKVTVELRNIEPDDDPTTMIAKVLNTLAREIKRGEHSPD